MQGKVGYVQQKVGSASADVTACKWSSTIEMVERKRMSDYGYGERRAVYDHWLHKG